VRQIQRIVIDERVIMTSAQMPMSVRCFNCGHDGLTRVELVNGACVTLSCILCCVFGCVLCAPCTYCMPGLKDIHHYCGNCNVIVAIKKSC